MTDTGPEQVTTPGRHSRLLPLGPVLLSHLGRIVSLLSGGALVVSVVLKMVNLEHTLVEYSAYRLLAWIPDPLLAGTALGTEAVLAWLLLAPSTWRTWGLPAAVLFLTATGLLLAAETLIGSMGDCGCLPFMARDIGWSAVGQNFSAALVLVGVWGLADLK